MLMLKLNKIATLLGAVVIVVLGIGVNGAFAVGSGTVGTPPNASSTQFNFAGYSPTTTATLTANKALVLTQSAFSSWGGGMQDWDSGGSINIASAFTPSSIHGTYGMGLDWQTNNRDSGYRVCTGLTPPLNPGTVYTCETDASFTLTFTNPVTNPVINVTNLAGGRLDSSLWSDYSLAGPGSLLLLGKAGNFEVHSDGKSFGVIQKPGTGRLASDSWGPTNLYPTSSYPNRYGSGNGSVMVVGTYSSVTFNVTLKYYNFEASQYTPTVNVLMDQTEWIEIVPTIGVPISSQVVANPQSQVTPLDTVYSGSAVVLGNSPATRYSVVSNPSHGSVALNADGTFAYTPNTGYTGTDVFTYKLCDPNDATNCASSTVTITIGTLSLATTGYRYLPYWVFGSSILGLGLAMLIAGKAPRRRTARSTARH